VAFEADLQGLVLEKAARCGDLAEAVGYSMRTGGKRLRAKLVFAAHESVGGKGDATGLAAAVEAIHAY